MKGIDFRDLLSEAQPRPRKYWEVEEYRNEQDLEKRLNLAYEYQIGKDDLYVEDYNQIIDDMYRAMEEFI